MARQEIEREDEERPAPRARSLLPAAGLLAILAGLMVLGAFLHARVPAPLPAAEREEPLPEVLPPLEPAPAELPAPEPDAPPGAWTLQLAAVCEPASIERLRAQVGTTPGLALRPLEVRGRPCRALTWGAFASRAEAASAAVPPAVAKLGTPTPKEFR